MSIQVKAQITAKWAGRGYVPVNVHSVEAYSVDSALDTDTDSWNLQIGDLDFSLIDMLGRDSEVRVSIFALGDAQTQALNTGFADSISMDENNVFTLDGRDLTAVAVDSQHPPQIWHSIRPEVLVANEARQLKIGDRLQLDKADGFKSYSTDGSESYWDVWYRFYRKRRKWLYAEPDGGIIATSLNYTGAPAYFFGESKGMVTNKNSTWIPVSQLEWRADKTQRVGEIYVFGQNHKGKVGFVAKAVDPTTKTWIKRPTRIVESADVHNYAEAKVEAWEELFESKVGSVEIKLTVADPGFIIRQNTMALVNLPSLGLRGTFFVVGAQNFGSITDGQYQIVRLREKNYAITRRVPTADILNAGPSDSIETRGNIAANLSGDFNWKDSFVLAANTYRGPWPFSVFLGVLLSICQHESGFRNVRAYGSTVYPGSYEGVKEGTVPSVLQQNAFSKFAATFANEAGKGYTNTDYAVGPLQLLTTGYKLYADRLFDPSLLDDEFIGGRWDPHSNIMAGAAAFASKLGAGSSISPQGEYRTVSPSGISLQPTENNIWQGVANYFGSNSPSENQKYADAVREIYENTYKADVSSAVATDQTAVPTIPDGPEINDPGQDSSLWDGTNAFQLQTAVLNNANITWTRQSQKDDVKNGRIFSGVLRGMMIFTAAGFKIVVLAMRSDHNTLTTEGRVSAHSVGCAFDNQLYNISNPDTDTAMKWLAVHQTEMGFSELIGPNPALVIPYGIYDAQTLAEHKSHIHLGWPLGDAVS